MTYVWTGGSLVLEPKRFFLRRDKKIVAEGVQFSSGKAVLAWCMCALPTSTVVWDSVQDAMTVHGHDGETTVEWLDHGYGERATELTEGVKS
jgi:hypothetical protein